MAERKRLNETKPWVRLMLDSGAFTVWRQGEKIDLSQYIEFIQGHRDLLSSYINLDVMPGKPGVARSPAETEAAAEASYRNAVQMRKAGLRPMPVFHMGERWYWLEKLVGEGFPYIGLGGMAVSGDAARTPWIQEAFGKLCGRSSHCAVKIHGLGVTSVEVMNAFPWYSVDSVTWMKQGVNGSIYVPKSRIRLDDSPVQYDYRQPAYAIAVSASGKKGPSSQALGHNTHIDSCGDTIRQYVKDYVHSAGFDLKELAEDYEKRIQLNARFFKHYAESRSPVAFRTIRNGLLDRIRSKGLSESSTPHAHFRLVFSVGTYLEYANLLRREGCRDQLISYHRVSTGPSFNLAGYVTDGWFVRRSMEGKKNPQSGERCGRLKGA